MTGCLKAFPSPPGESKMTSSKGHSPPQSGVNFPLKISSSLYCFDLWSSNLDSCFPALDLAIVSLNHLLSSLPKQRVLIPSFNRNGIPTLYQAYSVFS